MVSVCIPFFILILVLQTRAAMELVRRCGLLVERYTRRIFNVGDRRHQYLPTYYNYNPYSGSGSSGGGVGGINASTARGGGGGAGVSKQPGDGNRFWLKSLRAWARNAWVGKWPWPRSKTVDEPQEDSDV
jgi:hypothetical protein